jgi:cell division protein FtsQ
VAKSHSTSHKKFLGAFLGISLLAGSAYLLGWSSLFTVKHITVIGAPTNADVGIIEQVSQIDQGEKMARLEPRAASALLQKIVWLDHSTITQSWLNGSVVIRVWPRTPVATFNGKLIDQSGNVFELPNFISGMLPILIAKDRTSAQFAISLLTQLPTLLRSRLVAITVIGLNSASLSLRQNTQGNGKILEVLWGDASNMDLKVKVYQALIALPENVAISQMDLSAPYAPVVR